MEVDCSMLLNKKHLVEKSREIVLILDVFTCVSKDYLFPRSAAYDL